MTNSKTIAAVEIGTSKVIAVVAEVAAGQSISLLGKGEATSLGVRRGEIINFRQACEATHAALNAAEKNSRTNIDSVYLSLSGRQLEGFYHVGTTAINAPNGIVSDSDIARVTENARSKILPEGRLYLHHIKNGFHLDGRFVENPLHQKGQKLEVAYWHIHADARRVSEAMNVINRYGLPVEDIVTTSVASALVSPSEEEKKKGCIVLDIGGGASHYALYRNGFMARAGVISIGGDHLTNDLSIALRVNLRQAETLKKAHAKAIAEEGDKNQQRWLYGDLLDGNSAIGNRPIKTSAFAQVLAPRLEELFDLLRDELGDLYEPSELKGGIILSGGSSRLTGLIELAGRRLMLPAKQAAALPWVSDATLKGPEYTTVMGLLYSALTLPVRTQQNPGRTTLLNKLSKLFNLT
jgi:cell division protein FtsA